MKKGAKKAAKKRAKLGEYRRKRRFDRTPEPSGGDATKTRRSYVIQKHAATRLHYDFRLEHHGVLLSWAVPKGPSYDPADKRLAVQVEDHPIDYGGFEGQIPKGEYGGGNVLLWDRGVWHPQGDVDEMLRKGQLKFRLEGEKLRGGWALIRLRPRPGARESKPQWLLIKEKDGEAAPGSDIVTERPESVKSGRTIEAVDSRSVWHSARNGEVKASSIPSMDLELATLVAQAPEGDDWAHETKFDGVRLLAYVDRGDVRLVTRNEKDWAARVPAVAQALAKLPAKQAVLDGEIVVLDEKGISRFQLLQRAFLQPTRPPIYVAFDLLFLDGEDLRPLPLEERKARLRKLLPRRDAGLVRRSDAVVGDGRSIFEKACRGGLEGIVSKRLSSTYVAGRGRDWCKTKCVQRQEFVIAGWTESTASKRELGALVVGVHDRSGKLVPAGKVGSGFDGELLEQLRTRLAPLEVDAPPFDGPAPRLARVHWVKPKLVAELKFSEWTADGSLRHPVFVGLRDDKPASEIVHERPVAPPPSDGGANRKPARVASGNDTAIGDDPRVLGIVITHADRLVIPESKATKRALAEYFAEIGERMAPYAFGRTLALVRCPAGAAQRCFFQKHLDESIAGVDGVNVAKPRQAKELQPVLRSTEGLVALAQRSVVELHIWGSRADELERPDRIVFDLDPSPELPWRRVVEGAHHVRTLLDAVRLRSWILLTGGKGAHVIAPIVPDHEWDDVKAFAAAIAHAMEAAAPDRYVSRMSKSARAGRVFVDYLRNGRGATAIAPFSPRIRPGAPVAAPIDWGELPKLRGDAFDLFTIRRRVARQRRDPWGDYAKARQSLRTSVLRDLKIDTRRGSEA